MQLTDLLSEIPLSLVLQWFFYGLLFVVAIYSIILAYHWFSYGTSKKASVLALAIYLSGLAILCLAMSGLLIYIQ